MRRKPQGLPQRLHQARLDKGVTIAEMAAGSGVKETTLKKWLGGHSLPRANNLRPVADYLVVSMDWLMGGEGEANELGLKAPVPVTEPALEGEDVPEMGEAEERLLFALADNIERIHNELGVVASREQLRAMTVQQYRALSATTTAEERRTQRASLVALVGRQLRRDLLKEQPGGAPVEE